MALNEQLLEEIFIFFHPKVDEEHSVYFGVLKITSFMTDCTEKKYDYYS